MSAVRLGGISKGYAEVFTDIEGRSRYLGVVVQRERGLWNAELHIKGLDYDVVDVRTTRKAAALSLFLTARGRGLA